MKRIIGTQLHTQTHILKGIQASMLHTVKGTRVTRREMKEGMLLFSSLTTFCQLSRLKTKEGRKEGGKKNMGKQSGRSSNVLDVLLLDFSLVFAGES